MPIKQEENFMKKNSPPLKPSALVNFRKTDSQLSNIIGNFWKLVWGNDNPAIDQKQSICFLFRMPWVAVDTDRQQEKW